MARPAFHHPWGGLEKFVSKHRPLPVTPAHRPSEAPDRCPRRSSLELPRPFCHLITTCVPTEATVPCVHWTHLFSWTSPVNSPLAPNSPSSSWILPRWAQPAGRHPFLKRKGNPAMLPIRTSPPLCCLFQQNVVKKSVCGDSHSPYLTHNAHALPHSPG